MPSCCICGLEYAPSKTGVVFHKFSKNVEKRNYWIASIKKKIKNFSEKDATVICHQHFDKCYYMTSLSGKFVLKANAVPSIFNMPLKSKYSLIDQEEELLESSNKELSNKTCLNIQTGVEKTENLSCSSKQQKSLLKRNFIVTPEVFENSIEDISNKDKVLKEMKEKNNLLQKKLKICQQKCRRYKLKIDSLTCISKEKLGKVQNIKRIRSKCNKITFAKLK